MPRIFSPHERDKIDEALKDSARRALRDMGIKKTTIDGIVKDANIAKGSFYLFYESKEDLFLALVDSFIQRAESLYLEMLQNLDENHIVTSLTEVFYAISHLFYKEGIFRFFDKENITLIERKVSPKRLEAVKREEKKAFRELFSYFSIDSEADIKAFIRGYRAILHLYNLSDEIEKREEIIKFLIRGLVLQMVE